MCDYCEKMKSIYWNTNLNESPIREVYIEPDKTMSITANFGTADGFESSSLNIDFCPMCGKRLKESEYDDLILDDDVRDCTNCANQTDSDEIDNRCYMCCKGLENNFIPIDEAIEYFKE